MKGPHLFAAGMLIALAASAWGDTITMKDGRVFAGTYLGGNAREISIDLGPEVRTLQVSEIARIEFSSLQTARSSMPPRAVSQPTADDPDRPVLRRAPDDVDPSQPVASTTAPPPPMPPAAPPSDPDRPVLRRAPDATDPSQPVASSTATPPPAAPPSDPDRPILHRTDGSAAPATTAAAPPPAGSVTVPAGTNIVVRLIDAVDSTTATQGQSFAASLDQPLELNGQTLIPRGASAVLRLVEAKESGKFTGRTELALALISVKVKDQYVDMTTQTVTRVSDARGQETAKVVGGAAAVGAIIGAIAGGGKGAAIGAGAGGAAGAGVQTVTKGQKVKIPSETRLTFVLENPVTF